jgi:hypothetical protein
MGIVVQNDVFLADNGREGNATLGFIMPDHEGGTLINAKLRATVLPDESPKNK